MTVHMDPGTAEVGQHYESINDPVIARAAFGAACMQLLPIVVAVETPAKPLPAHQFGAIMTSA